ncbi:30S ribosomal protein S12 methylthiotransferase RimO, partial [bacterium]|nr:30S ribosomal protein S12 methylthiotransferase RimO [bacterium]
MMSKNQTIGILQFGCSKNLIDTELMLGILTHHGYKYSLNPYDENIKTVIISTCSFIHDAEKECIKGIMEMIKLNKKIILTGCLVQKYKDELIKLLPEVKGFVGATSYDKIIDVLENNSFQCIQEKPEYNYCEDVEREQITTGSSSYIKIADGCFYNCGYCIIPKLRGSYKSRKIENIVEEAKNLA